MIEWKGMLREASEPKYAKFSSSLIPGRDDIIGVRVPTIRKIAKDVLKDDWRSVVSDTPSNFEEQMVQAIVIATTPVTVEERISMSRDFVPCIDNWSTCDTFCNSWTFDIADSGKVWRFLEELISSGNTFTMRVAVVMAMTHFMDDDHIDDVISLIMNHDDPGYYYRMGAAWALSMCYVRYPEKVERILESGILCDETQNLTIRKIRESLRVSAEDKENVKRFKR